MAQPRRKGCLPARLPAGWARHREPVMVEPSPRALAVHLMSSVLLESYFGEEIHCLIVNAFFLITKLMHIYFSNIWL